MKETRDIMGMPVNVEIADAKASTADFEAVFSYLREVDATFSTYEAGSEISAINSGALALDAASDEMREVFRLAQETNRLTDGYFDIRTPSGSYDPSGLVKGWAIHNAALLLEKRGLNNFYVDIGGDIEAHGVNIDGLPWRVGIRNPFKTDEIIKVLELRDEGIATSGTYLRGAHIYDPHQHAAPVHDVVSLTVLGPDVYEADRFATAAFAMGRDGIRFIDGLDGFEGYMIDTSGTATMTRGFAQHTYVA
jgi:thiamine biosynthesis lipoprotein